MRAHVHRETDKINMSTNMFSFWCRRLAVYNGKKPSTLCVFFCFSIPFFLHSSHSLSEKQGCGGRVLKHTLSCLQRLEPQQAWGQYLKHQKSSFINSWRPTNQLLANSTKHLFDTDLVSCHIMCTACSLSITNSFSAYYAYPQSL